MNRNPPDPVKRVLRAEVGFGCPVPGCGNPYLEWHHFDPPWRIEEHHRPSGMIALCREHHIQADHGAFTIEQTRSFKLEARKNWSRVQGKFNWMRNRLLAVVGGNFFYETLVIFQFRDNPIIWFERNEDGYILLNLLMLTASGQERAGIRNNEWLKWDMCAIEFIELDSISMAQSRYVDARFESWGIDFPVTAVEVTSEVAGANLSFNAKETVLGNFTFKNCFSTHCGVAYKID